MEYLNLASGAAHFKSPVAATEKTIEALRKNETFYGETEGLTALRQAIAARYQADYQVTVPVEKLLVTSGTKQALFTLFSILLQPGDEVILPRPTWFGFKELFKVLQVKAVWLETLPEENYTIPAAALENLVTAKTRLFIFSNPGNPTGRIYSALEIQEWLQVLEKYPQVKVLSDEIYDLIVFDQIEMPSLLQVPDPQQKHFVVNGFSKNFGMSGWRIGYLIGPEKEMAKAADFQHATISGVNPFIQEGAVAALQTKAEFLPARLSELSHNREILCNWLTSRELISFFRPQGAYYVCADLSRLLQSEPFQNHDLGSTAKLCNYLKENYRLEFIPGERFDAPGFVRITFAVAETDLREALNRLDALLAEVKTKQP